MTPAKPFPTYKWRWLSVQPSKSLLQAPIFLGVLRALHRHEGASFSNTALRDDLAVVQDDTSSPVNLAREPERNLFRNSGQYWRGTGLLSPERGVIQLTGLGRRVATGQVTQGEFAALMVQQTVLPNPVTYKTEEIAKWRAARLEIRPLHLILKIVEELGRNHGGSDAARINNNELIKIIIPLAGAQVSVPVIAEHIIRNRNGQLNLTGWPDCAPAANDVRVAREFLLFLGNFGLLRQQAGPPVNEQNFYLNELFDADAAIDTAAASIFSDDASANLAIESVRHSALPSIIERQRVLTTILARPGQSRFRQRIIAAFTGQCFITGETIREVLEAAHIVPVNHNGADEENNGLCMRVDIHRLYDSGQLRIRPDGTLALSESVSASPNYRNLPSRVIFPSFTKPANIIWRDRYL